MGKELVTFGCGHCRTTLEVVAEAAGGVAQCPVCAQWTHVPEQPLVGGGGLITFSCGHCRQLLDIGAQHAGGVAECAFCKKLTHVPQQSQHYEGCLDDPTVSMRMGLPGGPSLQGSVSRSDAGKLGFAFMGGLLTVAGVIFGIKLNDR